MLVMLSYYAFYGFQLIRPEPCSVTCQPVGQSSFARTSFLFFYMFFGIKILTSHGSNENVWPT